MFPEVTSCQNYLGHLLIYDGAFVFFLLLIYFPSDPLLAKQHRLRWDFKAA